MPDNSRAENWLLDLVVGFRYPLEFLIGEEIEVALNRDGHGLNETEMIEVLHRLFNEGLIIASRHDLDEEKEPVEFSPTKDEIKSGLHGLERIYYGLTQQGGKIWEARSNPNWDKYLSEFSGIDRWELISMDIELIRKALLFETRWSKNSFLIENQVWDTVSSWEATYWKTLPFRHRLRFDTTHFSEEETQRREEQGPYDESQQRYDELSQWSQERDNWYTRLW